MKGNVFVGPCLAAWLALGMADFATLWGGSMELTLNYQLTPFPALEITGGSGKAAIEYSDSLSQNGSWILLGTIQTGPTPVYFADPTARNSPQRYYRATLVGSGSSHEPVENPDKAYLVWIEPGSFIMGSPPDESGRQTDEGPQVLVTLSQGFWMGKYEVTQLQYEFLMGENPSWFKGDPNLPAECVTWDDAMAYCARLARLMSAGGLLPAGYEIRLPTEAEWEYCCRAGTASATAFGNALSSLQANFNGSKPYGVAAEGPYLQATTPAGSYPPNAWGLYDMHGNVWEWCLNWHTDSPERSGPTDPSVPDSGSYRIIRGGGWNESATCCRSAFRSGNWPGYASNGYLGFRIVVAPINH